MREIALRDGRKPPRNTNPITEETRLKMRLAKLGKVGNNLGYRFTDEQRKKLSTSHLGQVAWNKGIEWLEFRGEKHPRWVFDRNKLQKYGNDNQDRRSSAYRYWRQQVWLRDNFACKIANPDCSGRIEAHHILSYREHPELRYEINNGITLCHFHHPRVREEEKRLSPYFQELVSVSKETF